MRNLARQFHTQLTDALRGRVRHGTLGRLIFIAALAAMGYGAVMGSFGVLYGQSGWQVLFAAIKSPMLLAVTFVLTLPSFLVINLLLGLGRDVKDVLHALAAGQVAVSVGLLSLSPLTLLWYLSVPRYEPAILFNAAMFAVASLGGQRPLRALYRPLILRNPLHRRMLVIWLTVYAFVGVQAGWVMRPFIGKPDAPAEFLRPEKWDNAYVVIVKILYRSVVP
ncbi:MAG: hypothetical protein QM754_11710 [Tepidisphaeraceae bacterium]